MQHLRRAPRNAERKKSVPRRPQVLRKVQSQSEDDQRSCRQPVETAARQKARRLDGQTGWFHIMAQMLVSSQLASKQASKRESTNSRFLLQFDRESDLTTSSKPHLWVEWADKLENLLIEKDRDRRRKVTEKVTTIQLRLVAEELLKNPKRTSWGWSSLVKAPPSTPINPSGR